MNELLQITIMSECSMFYVPSHIAYSNTHHRASDLWPVTHDVQVSDHYVYRPHSSSSP